MKALDLSLFLAAATVSYGQVVKTAEVVAEKTEQTVRLPGEFLPYQSVDIHARVAGFVESVKVDRGSTVRQGELLVTLSAPEMKAGILEAQSKVKALEAQRLESEAKVLAAQATYDRLKAASATPGAIAGNELVQAEKAVAAARAAQQGIGMSVQAAQASVEGLLELERYLNVTAPFDGVVTDRYVHPGALAGPASGGSGGPLLRLEQVSRLRLVVPLPEAEAGSIPRGARVPFSVPAFPGQTFHGVVARVGRSMDAKTRTLPVEVDVRNDGKLAPGMYAEVLWPVRRGASLLVPASSIVTTSARSFVIRVTAGRADWVDVRRIRAAGDRVMVNGNLAPGDRVVLQATDEIRDGSRVKVAQGS